MRKGRDGGNRKKRKRLMEIMATTSLPAVDRPNADRWNAARLWQNCLSFLCQRVTLVIANWSTLGHLACVNELKDYYVLEEFKHQKSEQLFHLRKYMFGGHCSHKSMGHCQMP